MNAARGAKLDDVPWLVELMADFYRESGLAIPEDAAGHAFTQLIGHAGLGRVWLLESSGERAGYIVLTLGFSMEYGGLRGFVDDLFVRTAHRRKGLATLGLAELRRRAIEVGARALIVEVAPGDAAARRLYETAGFVPAADRIMMTSTLTEDVR